ncbi:hypothetical protein I4U23_024405 [Adineta vaga]|nr:hypothetical protein I4U23_024405 [Adineta vaga]
MITINILLFQFILSISITTTTTTTTALTGIRSCHVESYISSLNFRNCLHTPVNIKATRCNGHCYSEEYLTDDWETDSIPYRYHRMIHCCSPNVTITHQISVICNNKQRRIIEYPIITHCECKSCTNNC